MAARELVLGATEGFDGCCTVWRFATISKPMVRETLEEEQKVDRRTVVTRPHREQNLADIHTGNGSVGLAPRTTHSSLQSIGTGTRQHLVDTNNVVRVGADTEMETFFAGDFDEIPMWKFLLEFAHVDGWGRTEYGMERNILVRADTGSFESFRGQLLVLVGDHVDAEGKFIDIGTLAAQIENANFGIGDTAVET